MLHTIVYTEKAEADSSAPLFSIIFLCFLVAQTGGVHAVATAFPRVRIVTSAVDPTLEERALPIREVDPVTGEHRNLTKKCWAILPGGEHSSLACSSDTVRSQQLISLHSLRQWATLAIATSAPARSLSRHIS